MAFDWGSVISAGGSLLGGLLDRETSSQINSGNVAANNATIAGQAASREGAMDALTGTVGDVGTTRNSGGGFDTQFTPGSSSDVLKQGDLQRALTNNELTNNFSLNVPDVATAQGIVDRDNALVQSSFDDQANRAVLRQTQEGGQAGIGAGNSSFNPRLMDTLARVSDSFRLNREQGAHQFLNSDNSAQIGALQQQLALNNPQAPNMTGVGGMAAAVNGQIPMPAVTPDVGGAATSAAGSNLISQLMMQQTGREQQARQDDMFNRLLASGSFSQQAPVMGP